ncbi:MAG: CYTH domain-containing protein [Bacteroidales bacterium]|jgi:CYTH domain-containing protein|nr:CYTH domain-containing protein [Bacteroidales bacterium]
MPKEIERKFLLNGNDYRNLSQGKHYRQGYLASNSESTIRVRTIDNSTAVITIKGKKVGFTCPEFEYNIPVEDAIFILTNICVKPIIEKIRYRVPLGELVWEIDEFMGENEGLIVAEVELPAENYPVLLPAWVGKEVTLDWKYQNASLVRNPYKSWSK